MSIRSKLKHKNKSHIKSKQLHKSRSRRIYKSKKQTRRRYRKSNKKKRKSNKKNRKTNRRYKKYNKNKQKGGFYFGTKTDVNLFDIRNMDYRLNKYFTHIFRNNIVTIEPLGNEGIYGTIFVVKFMDTCLQGLTDNDYAIRDYKKNPSKMILVKIVYIDQTLSGSQERAMGQGAGRKISVSKQAFNYEVQIQQHVFKRTNSHLQPITPLIYYNAVHNTDESKALLRLLHTSANPSAKTRLDTITGLFTHSSQLNLGFIFMEMRDGYDTVAEQVRKNPTFTNTPYFLGMTGEVLNRLHYTCQVTHGDLHQGNVLINTSEQSYYSPKYGNILLIDWGRSKLHNNGVRGTGPDPDPRAETSIELEALGRGNSAWWSYRWLNLPKDYRPGRNGPGGRYGHPWNDPAVKHMSVELRRARPPNYTTPDNNRLPGYFYQPANVNCQWQATWKKKM